VAAAYLLAGFHPDGGPHRDARLEIRSGERNYGAGLELERAAGQRHFEGRRAFRVAHQKVARAQGEGIRRSGCRDAQVRVAGPAEILDGGQQARRDDANVVQMEPFTTNLT